LAITISDPGASVHQHYEGCSNWRATEEHHPVSGAARQYLIVKAIVVMRGTTAQTRLQAKAQGKNSLT
jgi:hypothetical protein